MFDENTFNEGAATVLSFIAYHQTRLPCEYDGYRKGDCDGTSVGCCLTARYLQSVFKA